MEADWEVQIGGGAPVIEPEWEGFVDLRRVPEAAEQLPEAGALPGLAQVLMRLNAPDSPVWTAKCDVWKMDDFDPLELDAAGAGQQLGAACFVDLLPQEKTRWGTHADAAEWCRNVCGHLRAIALRSCRVDLVVRAAEFAEEGPGFAVTAYASAVGADETQTRQKLAQTLAALADTLEQSSATGESGKQLQ
jgi:hypothetical protein